MAQEALRSEDDERLLVGVAPLPPQQVEVGRRRRRIGDAHVALGAESQEALDARARVLRALALVAVRQQEREAARLAPLRLGAGEELVDDDLRPVDEVAELRLPHHECPVVGHRVAVLEAEDGLLREERVVHLEVRAGRRDRVQRHVLPGVLHVVQHRVALRERAAAGVLARQAHGDALEEERPPRERLGRRPVGLALPLRELAPPAHERHELRVDLDAVGERAEGLQHGAQPRAHRPRVDRGQVLRQPPRDDVERRPGRLLVGGHLGLLLGPDLVELLPADDALAHELLAVERRGRRVALDPRVHDGLRVARLVRLVVAPAPVADEVDDHVLPELLAVLEGEAGDVGHRLGVVAVHVEGRGVDHLRDVGRVGRRARVLRHRGEADLVVDDDVDRAARAVAVEAGEVHRLGDDALAGEGRVAVQQHRQDARVLAVADRVLLGADHALDDRVHELEVARVRGEAHADRLARVGLVRAARAEVVLHVARALVGRRVVALELREDLREGLADRVGEDVEPSPVRHAEDDLAEPPHRRVVQDPVEERDERLAALEREALVADVLRVEEALEALGLDELLEHPPLRRRVEGRVVARDLHAVLQPVLPFGVGDVHVLDADRPTVGLAQDVEDVAQRRAVLAGEPARHELAVEVPQREPVGRGVEVAVGRPREEVQRIEVGHQVPAHPVVVDELQHLRLLVDLLAAALAAEESRVRVHLPLDRAERHAEVAEDAVVEAVLALEELLHPREEEARLGALDDAVVVRRRHRHHLRDAEEAERPRGHRAVLGRVVEGARRDDDALAGHEPRRRRGRADRAGVRERHRRAHEVVGRDRALPRAGHELVEGLQERGEVELPRVLDVRDEEGPRAVLLLHVDRDAEADLVALDAVRLALDLGKRVVHPREGVERPQDRPRHDVREADLREPRRLAVLVEEPPVLLERPHGHGADGGRGRDLEARLHVLDDAHGAAADRLEDVARQHGHAGDGGRAAAPGGRLGPGERLEAGSGGRGRRGRGRGLRGLDHGHGRLGRGRRGGLRLDDGSGPGRHVEVRPPARLDAGTVLPVLLEEIEGEHVVPPEIVDEGLQERVGRSGAHPESLGPGRGRLNRSSGLRPGRLSAGRGCYLGAMPTAVVVPRELPFLESLSWNDRGWRELGPLEMLQRYEAGWRWRGVLADPSEEELAYVRWLVRTYGSVLRP